MLQQGSSTKLPEFETELWICLFLNSYPACPAQRHKAVLCCNTTSKVKAYPGPLFTRTAIHSSKFPTASLWLIKATKHSISGARELFDNQQLLPQVKTKCPSLKVHNGLKLKKPTDSPGHSSPDRDHAGEPTFK